MAPAEKEEVGEEKVTVMILEVDLKCHCCYKKVKKLLCKFPQIRDQVFDEDKNKVMITVVCCNPERIRDKLCCKGGKAIQTIEILDNKPKPQAPPPKPKDPPQMPSKNHPPAEKPKPPSPPPAALVPVPNPVPPKPGPPPKPDPPPKTEPPPKPDPPPKPGPMPPPVVSKPDPVKMPDPIPAAVPQPQPQPEPMPYPMDGYPQPFCPPVPVCCQECYEGRGGGPCHYGYGRPIPPPPGPCYDAYGYPYPCNRTCCVARCGECFSEENPQGCSIM